MTRPLRDTPTMCGVMGCLKTRPCSDKARSDDVPGCESCARLVDRGRPLFVEAERNKGRHARRTVEGKERYLCSPCANFARGVDRLPTKDELARYHSSGRWRVRVA